MTAANIFAVTVLIAATLALVACIVANLYAATQHGRDDK